MWLARMDIDALVARKEKIRDIYTWHKRIWDCFPGMSNNDRVFLFRIDQLERAFRLWLLAKLKPVRPTWCPEVGFALKEIAPSFLQHRYYAFDLRANPTKKLVIRDTDGTRHKGKRIPLVKEDELRVWLDRKGRARCLDQASGEMIPGGFRIMDKHPLEISPMQENMFRKKDHTAWHGGVQFRGVLQVTDRDHFMATYQNGVGSAKGFGFGLFLIAPVNL